MSMAANLATAIQVLAGVPAAASAAYWLRSAAYRLPIAKLPKGADDIGYEDTDGELIALVGTLREQSRLSGIAARWAAAATLVAAASALPAVLL
jgi:hypothetical protein